jgi:hypothetical protein
MGRYFLLSERQSGDVEALPRILGKKCLPGKLSITDVAGDSKGKGGFLDIRGWRVEKLKLSTPKLTKSGSG